MIWEYSHFLGEVFPDFRDFWYGLPKNSEEHVFFTELSTDKTEENVDRNTNDIAMVNRGTNDFKDVMTDAKLFLLLLKNQLLPKILFKRPRITIELLISSPFLKFCATFGGSTEK